MSARGFAEGWSRYETEPASLPALAAFNEAVAAASPELRAAIRTAADGLVAGRFSALGRDWPRRWPGTPIPPHIWRLDPVTGRLWPGAETFAFDIGKRHGRGLGDIRYVWEFNRLQHLQPLAAEVLLSADRKALLVIEETIASWHEANPPFRGIAWRSGRECALRLVSLIVVASLAGPRLSTDTARRLGAMIAAHAFWSDRFATSAPSAETKGLTVATAEILCALMAPALAPDDDPREARARRTIADEAARLVHPDGTPAETSPGAGAFAAELLLIASLAASAAGRPLPPIVAERLSAFAHHVGWIADGDGGVPAIGDDDGSRVLSLGSFEPRYAVSVARAIAGHLGIAVPGLPSGPPHLRDSLAGTETRPAEAPLGLKTFEVGGLSVLREQRAGRALALVVDHGRDGPHEDTLALLATIDGRPLFVDAGTALSHANEASQAWARARRAHNTLTVEEGEETEVTRALDWLQSAEGRLDAKAEGEAWRLASGYEGYRARLGVRHERTIEATSEGFAVRDRLIGSDAPLKVEIVFQLAPDIEATREGSTVRMSWPGRPLAPVRLVFETPGEIALTRAGTGGAGWVSPSFGMRHPAWRVSWRGRIASTGSLVQVILG